MATVSLSKGVFVFRRTKSRKDRSDAAAWHLASAEEDSRAKDVARTNYKNCLSFINEKIQELLQAIHTQVFDDLITYILGCHTGSHGCPLDADCKRDIPTACLVTGVNMPDHDTIFKNLARLLNDRVTPHVARLSASDCSTIKGLMQKLVRSLINTKSLDLSDTEDEDEVEPSRPKLLKRTQCNMSVLSAWYKHSIQMHCHSDPSPQKRKKTQGERTPRKDGAAPAPRRPPLIVIVEDVEGVHPRVLQDFVLICSEYQRNLPFIFILGVSTTPLAVHRSLNQDASSCIAIETFQARPSSNVLSQIVEEVMMTPTIPFHVGGRIFKLLMDVFLYHNLSVNNFIAGFKYCMLEHFSFGEASFLCSEPHIRRAIVSSLDQSLLDKVKSVPSFSSYLETLEKEEIPRKERSHDELKELISRLIDELEFWYSDFCIMAKVLFSLVANLPGHPLGRHLREVFIACLNKPIKESDEFQEAWQLLALSARGELLDGVQKSLEILKELRPQSPLSQLRTSLSNLFERLQDIGLLPETEPLKSVPIDLKSCDRFQLREKLLEAAKQKQKRGNPYDSLRSEILSIYEHWFITYLRPITKPLHEAFFFDSVSSVKYQLLGPLRATITTGLSNPQKYFQCACCHLEDLSDISPSLPDLSVVYKLHLECGTYINLYDWLQAFVAVVGGERDDEDAVEEEEPRKKSKTKKVKPPRKKKSVDQQLHARFVQAVSELQLLGFIKPTKRKTDHVQRLTWGGT